VREKFDAWKMESPIHKTDLLISEMRTFVEHVEQHIKSSSENGVATYVYRVADVDDLSSIVGKGSDPKWIQDIRKWLGTWKAKFKADSEFVGYVNCSS
jgi:hypothetical protein